VEDPLNSRQEWLRAIPSVERLLEHSEMVKLAREIPRWMVVEAAREVLAEKREAIMAGRETGEAAPGELVEAAARRARAKVPLGIRRVINATGIVIHTNLGRSLLSERAVEAVRDAAGGYSSLEYDVASGKRTSRTRHVEDLLCKITGAEAAFVVNNNAAAVLLALNTISSGGETIVSRGELVEIGGSFRLPDVMEQSRAVMVEVGTTNRTRVSDYAEAITPSTKVLLKVHHSNFEMTGYVEEVGSRELAELARERGLVVMEDLGSGALVDLAGLGTEKEPMPQESLGAGVDVVTFSGDKLMGGPQAGLILGGRETVARMKANPLARALRIDKLTLAALEETLRHYLDLKKGQEQIPTLRLIAQSHMDLRGRAESVAKALAGRLGAGVSVNVIASVSQVGGGSLPAAELKSFAVALASDSIPAGDVAQALRFAPVPIVARIVDDRVLIDFRTVQPSEDELLIDQIAAAFAGGGPRPERS
jgi:L-seryl-tRNA(Ser) seleniumtransferase